MTDRGNARQRGGKRSRVLLAAKIATAQGMRDVRLRDISTKGALIEGEELPAAEEEVVFIRGSVEVPARIVWNLNHRAGLQFTRAIDEAQLLVAVPRGTGQQEGKQYRRPRLRGDDITRQERLLVKLWGMSVDIDIG